MAYGGAAAYAALVQATKASGAIIRLEPDAFSIIVTKVEKPLVVVAPSGWPNKGYQYLTSYKGLIFYTRSRTSLILPGSAEVISAKQIWIPS